MDKREAKKLYEISKLDDPEISESEKDRIRNRYNLIENIPIDFFDKISTEKDLDQLRRFIESNIAVANQNELSYQIPFSLKVILTLVGFGSYLESDGFWDYSDYNDESKTLVSEREDLLASLRVIGKKDIAERIEGLWKNHFKDDDRLAKLQKECWNNSFEKSFNETLVAFVKDSEKDMNDFIAKTKIE